MSFTSSLFLSIEETIIQEETAEIFIDQVGRMVYRWDPRIIESPNIDRG